MLLIKHLANLNSYNHLISLSNIWNWKRIRQIKREKEVIFGAFPFSLRQDVECVINILPFDRNIRYRFEQEINVDNLIHQDKISILLNNEVLKIPARIYFNEPSRDKENDLTDLQKDILNCFYLMHHDGFVRQKRLELLLDKNDYFIIPFKFYLLGEYVVEILEDLKKHITNDSVDSFVKFANENEKYFIRIESKMASFWNAHYRWKFQKLNQYVGRQNIDKIKNRMSKISRST